MRIEPCPVVAALTGCLTVAGAERERGIEQEGAIERACRQGQQRAEEDIEGGVLGYLAFDLPSDCGSAVHDRARRELGMLLYGLGCVRHEESDAFAGCYDIVMSREIEARGLDDDLQRIYDESCPD